MVRKMSYISFVDVKKEYRMGEVTIKAVDGVDFVIEKGEFAIIVGPSGAGKTTVLNMLGGMDACTSGVITVDGTKVSGFNAKQLTAYRRHDIGFVFQFYNLVQNLTALENVELASQICRRPHGCPARCWNRWGWGTGWTTFPPSCPAASSSGWPSPGRWLRIPSCLLCDEPTGALDYSHRQG